MIFWILVMLGVILPIVFGLLDGYAPISIMVLGWIMSACGIILVLILLVPLTGFKQETQTVDLRAVGTSSAIEGRSYFLTGGYVKEQRVLNFIYQEDGYSVMSQAKASKSRIFEGDDKPHVDIEYTVHENWWITPFKFYLDTKYDFHIPAGSVVEEYSVTN